MEPIEIIHLGTTEYYGTHAEAYREEYMTYCRFILIVEGKRLVMMEYPKLDITETV